MFHCVFGPLSVHLCALYVPVQLYENYDDDDDDYNHQMITKSLIPLRQHHLIDGIPQPLQCQRDLTPLIPV